MPRLNRTDSAAGRTLSTPHNRSKAPCRSRRYRKVKPKKAPAKKTVKPTPKSEPSAPGSVELKIETVLIETLSADPANARKHGKKDLDVLKASLRRFGQQKPIVVDANNIVRAGNGTFEAAKALGWPKIVIARSVLTGSEMTAYAIADNRTAELSAWDNEALKDQLMALAAEDINPQGLGWDGKDLDKLLDIKGDGGSESDGSGEGSGPSVDKYMVLITAKDEAHQAEMLERFTTEGLEVKALNQ
jgi:hypothetical protein